MSIIASGSNKWGTPFMKTEAGTVPMKAYVPCVISSYQYIWVDPNDFKNSYHLDEAQMKQVDAGTYLEHPVNEVKVVYYLTIPQHNAVFKFNPMSRSMNEKATLRKIAIAALGQEGLKIKECSSLIGAEIECLFEKKTSPKGTVYLKIKDIAAKEGEGWTE